MAACLVICLLAKQKSPPLIWMLITALSCSCANFAATLFLRLLINLQIAIPEDNTCETPAIMKEHPKQARYFKLTVSKTCWAGEGWHT